MRKSDNWLQRFFGKDADVGMFKATPFYTGSVKGKDAGTGRKNFPSEAVMLRPNVFIHKNDYAKLKTGEFFVGVDFGSSDFDVVCLVEKLSNGTMMFHEVFPLEPLWFTRRNTKKFVAWALVFAVTSLLTGLYFYCVALFVVELFILFFVRIKK